ncbi:cytochrome P450 [Streptomyces sp. 4N509B]|uniref:cytochrome P450 n=1 Tax=Streptomyces sp. 4N509B TaxID=3457413 RepID=UPI003FD5FD1D
MDTHLPPPPGARGRAGTPLAEQPLEPLMTRDFETRPALVYERLRARHGPVAPVELYGVPVWLVLGYREVMDILRDESQWKKDIGHWRPYREGRVPPDWPLLPAYHVSHLLHQDDQRRMATRAAVDQALRPYQEPGQPQAVELAAAVERYVDELITFFANGQGSGFVDLCSQFARPLPLMVINRLFGFPVEQGDDIFMDAWRMVDSGPDAGEAIGRLIASTTELAAYRREHPGDDLTTRLLQADPPLTPEEIGMELYAMLVFSDLVSHTITNSVVEVLAGNTWAQESLAVGTFQELVNRVHIASPPWTNLAMHFPVTDVTLGNYHVAAGDGVVPSVAAAHGDPLFADAVGDAVTSSRAHLAWGAGPHVCPSRELAEMMSAKAVTRLFERCDVELSLPVDQLPWRSSLYVRAVRSLPATFRMRWPGGGGAGAPAAAPGRPGGAAAGEPVGAVAGGGDGGPVDGGAAVSTPASVSASQERPRSRLWRFLASMRPGQRQQQG